MCVGFLNVWTWWDTVVDSPEVLDVVHWHIAREQPFDNALGQCEIELEPNLLSWNIIYFLAPNVRKCDLHRRLVREML